VKIIVFKDHENQIWLHIDKIKTIYTHEFALYIQITIYMFDGYQIEVNDHYKGYFNQMLYNFIKSDDNLKIIKVVDMNSCEDHAFFRTTDWVSQAMNKG